MKSVRLLLPLICLLAALPVAASLPAMAAGMPACPADPHAVRMNVAQASARARMMGFKVVSVEPDEGCWRVEATDDRGRRTVLRLHAATGELMARFSPDAVDAGVTASTD